MSTNTSGSVIFIGSQRRVLEATVESILRDFIQGKLDDPELPYQSEFAPYGGAKVVFADEEETETEAGPPYIQMEKTRVGREATQEKVEDGAGGEVIKNGWDWSFVYRADVIANEFTGALIGVENPVAAEEILSGHLETILDEGFEELGDLGLYEAEIMPEGESQDEEELDRINSHLISFSVTTANL